MALWGLLFRCCLINCRTEGRVPMVEEVEVKGGVPGGPPFAVQAPDWARPPCRGCMPQCQRSAIERVAARHVPFWTHWSGPALPMTGTQGRPTEGSQGPENETVRNAFGACPLIGDIDWQQKITPKREWIPIERAVWSVRRPETPQNTGDTTSTCILSSLA